MVNIKNVAKNFSRSSKSYAMAGTFQKLAAQKLFDLIDAEVAEKNEVERILELGCGTGFLTIGLMRLFPDAAFVVSDISGDMLNKCKKNIKPAMRKQGIEPFFECYNISEAKIEKEYNLIISALAFQWVSSLEPVMDNIRRRLVPGGKLVFSTLLQGTFSRLHEVFNELGIKYPGPELLSEEQLIKKCSVFDSVEVKKSRHTEEYASIMDFLKQVQLTGAKNASGTPVSVTDMRRVLKRYAELEGRGEIAVDYTLAEVICK